jgi:hypothetical protein
MVIVPALAKAHQSNEPVNQLFREPSRVANLRLSQKCVRELTIQVACSPMVTRKKTPHKNTGRPPKASRRIPKVTNGIATVRVV